MIKSQIFNSSSWSLQSLTTVVVDDATDLLDSTIKIIGKGNYVFTFYLLPVGGGAFTIS